MNHARRRTHPRFPGFLFFLCLGIACHCAPAARAQFTVTLPGGLGRQLPGRPQGIPLPHSGNLSQVCATLGKWADQLSQHYPQSDFMSMQEVQAETMAIPLFADEAFKPFFGISYLSMSSAQIDTALRQKFQPCSSGPNRSQAGLAVGVLIYAFNTHLTMHPLSPQRLTASLEQLRQARSTLAEQQQQLKELPPAAASYQQAQAMQTSSTEWQRLVWPEERADFASAVQQALAASAAPAMEQRLAPLLSATPSQQNVLALRALPQNHANVWKLLTPAQQQDFQRRADEASRKDISALLAREQADSLQFHGDLAGLDAGAAWYRTFESRWLSSDSAPQARPVADQYLHRRALQLAALEPGLRQKIAGSAQGQIEALSVFSLKADLDTPVYARLQKLAASRQAAVVRTAAAAVPATTRGSSEAAPRALSGELTPNSLALQGTTNDKVLRALYSGDFAAVPFERDDNMFGVLIGNYMETYAKRCDRYLGRDKVELMNTRCSGTSTVVDRYSVPVGPTSCVRWADDVPTGLYADPELYRAAHSASPSMASLLRGGLTVASNGLGGMASQMQSMADDNAILLERNACNSPSLMRFERNLELYATGRQPIRLDGPGGTSAATTEPQASNLAFRNSNFSKLLEDLVTAYSHNWLMNRYQTGSISNVQVSQRDELGRPAMLAAHYRFTNGSPRVYEGNLTIQFNDDVPECMYFFDQPTKCQTPDRKIVAAYSAGQYQ